MKVVGLLQQAVDEECPPEYAHGLQACAAALVLVFTGILVTRMLLHLVVHARSHVVPNSLMCDMFR